MSDETATATAEVQAEPVDPNVVTPVNLAKELGIRPQIVFGWLRNGGLPAHKSAKGTNVIHRDEFQQWQSGRAEKKAAREAAKAEKEAKKAAKAQAEASASPAPSGEEEE